MSNVDNQFVVGIGASAGGLDAVQQLFDNLPDDSGMSFVIIQHLSPDFKSLMPELLAKHTKMKIFTADDNQTIQPNCIYLNQRSKNLQLKGNKLMLLEKAPRGNLNLPIDIFFHSLGEEFMDKSFGVILSGTGSDGSRGIKTIKEAGGTILVQEPSSAQFDGMPNSAISTNLTDFVLSPKEIADRLIQLSTKRIDLQTITVDSDSHEKAFDSILELIYKSLGINFKKYKTNTLLRRIEKRMNVHNLETLAEYYILIKNNQKERAVVFQEFLIGVTSFFRDTEAFNIIKKKIIPAIANAKTKQHTLRMWVAGCSTGEEVYSIAILMEDYLRANKLNLDYKIFATDIDKKALQIAGLGNYTVNNIVEIDNKYLEDYFLKVGDRIQIVKRIREKIVFSYHDVTKDPPFIRMDFISCRNLLIYFNNNTQKKVLNNFQYALNKSAYLFLGSSESLGPVSKYFEVIDTKWKIYKNLTETKRIREDEDFENEPSSGLHFLRDSYNSKALEAKNESLQESHYFRYLSQKHAPTSVFIDKDYNILFVSGDLKEWFSYSAGLFHNNLLKITDVEIAALIRNGVRRVTKENKAVVFKELELNIDSETRTFDLSVEKIKKFHTDKDVYLIEFSHITAVANDDVVVIKDDELPNSSKQQIEDLETELKENRSELQNVVEELETSNEELQSSNEELMSSNEELQSSNEELQSVNEELYTVNSELQEKNKELEALNDDMNNLLNSNEVGTLFLDTQFNIRKFTPSVKHLFHLEDSDLGRSIVSFASEFDDESRQSIIKDSKLALEQLQSVEKEIHDKNGNWFLERISPFITTRKRIEGVVITFINIVNLKNTQEELKESNYRLQTALKGGDMAWWEVHLPEGKVVFSPQKAIMLGRKADDFKHYTDFTNLIHPDDYQATMNAFSDHLAGKKQKYDCEYRIKNSKGEYQWFHDVGQVSSDDGEKKIVSGIVTEITSKKEAERHLLEAQQKAESANVYKNQFLANMSHEIRTPMNGLVGFANLLRDDDLNSETKNKYIDIIENSSKQLLNLIDDIIDVSKIEARELKINKKPSKLSDLFYATQSTFSELKNEINKEQVEIAVNIPKESENLVLDTDPDRLQQVLVNLVNNALKFTEKGRIEFGYKQIDDKVAIYVTDEGIGIPNDKFDIIFNRFEQIRNGNNDFNEGTGLGLSISKGIVELLGGKLHVESQESIGSTFSFDLPYTEGLLLAVDDNNKTETNTIEDKTKDKTILIVEDELVNVEYFKALFAGMSIKLHFALNGREAIEIVKTQSPIDIILMDIRMPDMDGFEAAKLILKDKPDFKIIAQTAYAMAGDKEKCLQSGFVDYISKPLKKEELLNKMARWIGN